MIVREATAADSAPIASLHAAGWQATYAQLLPSELLQKFTRAALLPKWEQRLSAAVARTVWVCEDETRSRVVGFLWIETSGGSALQKEILAMYVEPAEIGKGIGTRLLRYVFAQPAAAVSGGIDVWALATNPFQRFYIRNGATSIGQRTIEVGGYALQEVGYHWSRESILRMAGAAK